jgi:hypothetical protein
MSFGILLIVFGVTIALFPQILVYMISGLLITMGLVITLMSWRMRRMGRQASGWMFRW